jgi:hypothetical protein
VVIVINSPSVRHQRSWWLFLVVLESQRCACISPHLNCILFLNGNNIFFYLVTCFKTRNYANTSEMEKNLSRCHFVFTASPFF